MNHHNYLRVTILYVIYKIIEDLKLLTYSVRKNYRGMYEKSVCNEAGFRYGTVTTRTELRLALTGFKMLTFQCKATEKLTTSSKMVKFVFLTRSGYSSTTLGTLGKEM